MSFNRQEIFNVIPLPDVPEKEPSFSDRVNNTSSGSPTFKELCTNLGDQTFNTSYLRSGLLRKELLLVFPFTKI